MHCKNCGSSIQETNNFCGNCGKKLIENNIASASTQLYGKKEDSINSVKRGTKIKTMKKIATILYVINFIMQIATIFIVYNATANPEDIKEPPVSILFIILTLLYFKNLFYKNKKTIVIEYDPVIIFLGSFILSITLKSLISINQ